MVIKEVLWATRAHSHWGTRGNSGEHASLIPPMERNWDFFFFFVLFQHIIFIFLNFFHLFLLVGG